MLAQSCTAPTVLKPKSELPYALRVSPRRRRLRYSRKPSQRPQQDRRRASGRRLRSAHGAQTQTTTDSYAKMESASMPPMQQRRRYAGGRPRPDPAQHLLCPNNNQSWLKCEKGVSVDAADTAAATTCRWLALARAVPSTHGAQTTIRGDLHAKRGSASMPPIQQRYMQVAGTGPTLHSTHGA